MKLLDEIFQLLMTRRDYHNTIHTYENTMLKFFDSLFLNVAFQNHPLIIIPKSYGSIKWGTYKHHQTTLPVTDIPYISFELLPFYHIFLILEIVGLKDNFRDPNNTLIIINGFIMKKKLVRDLMIPVDQYPKVSRESSLFEAFRTLEESKRNMPETIEPYRAVLVVDDNNKIVGKMGYMAFLKALEPKYNLIENMDKLTRANLDSHFIHSMMENFKLWDEDILDVYSRARIIKVKDVMHPIEESISEDMPLAEAIHKIVMWQTMSLLVTQDRKIVGIIRLSDIYNNIALMVTNSFDTK